MGHLVLWDHVLWSFVVGLTPLALGLGWKLISSVGDPFHLAADPLPGDDPAADRRIAAHTLPAGSRISP